MSARTGFYYMAGDLGGTNTRLLLVRRDKPDVISGLSTIPQLAEWHTADDDHLAEVVVASKIYRSKDFNHLSVLVEHFLIECGARSDAALLPNVCVIAVAGPVESDNTANVTNLNWFLDGAVIAKTLGIPRVVLINDFAAIGYGLLAMGSHHLVPLNSAKPVPGAPKACLGAGTGLGECYLTHNGTEYDVWSAEGGHATFAPRDEFEFELMKFVRDTERLPRVSVERLVSGQGTPKIFDFLCRKHPDLVNPAVRKQFDEAKDKGQVITRNALAGTDLLCAQVYDIFIKLYGSEAGDFALKTLPFGGLYVSGGMAPRVVHLLKQQNKFMENMLSKGRLRPVLEKIPVSVVTHPQPGLLGSRIIARRVLRDEFGDVAPSS